MSTNGSLVEVEPGSALAAATAVGSAPLAVTVTATNRSDPEENQDRHAALNLGEHGATAVVVADGIGSWARSAEAAAAAVGAVSSVLDRRGPRALEAAFCDAWAAVKALAPQDEDPSLHCGTTLLVATVLSSGGVRVGYVGNGAVLAVVPPPGDGATSPDQLCWTNLLVPHAGFANGREALTRSFTTADAAPPAPSWVTCTLGGPVALAVVSDGIWSDEQNPSARTADGQRWSPRPPILLDTLQLAAECHQAFAAGAGSADIEHVLGAHLRSLHQAGELDDDATLGLLLLP